MGEMQQTFEALLRRVGKISIKSLPYPRAQEVAASKYASEVDRIYRRLGGGLPSFPLRVRSWDLEFEGTAVELDEYLHFNRYRLTTLDSVVYEVLPAFPRDLYREYCSLHEDRCLGAGSYGGKWSNDSCEAQFGRAAKLKNLAAGGAPRWKQRAFYDFVKDLSPLVIGVSLVRIAVWDVVEEAGKRRTVESILSAPSLSSAEALARLISTRDPSRLPV